MYKQKINLNNVQINAKKILILYLKNNGNNVMIHKIHKHRSMYIVKKNLQKMNFKIAMYLFKKD